jgi:hypothetical protein
LAASSAPLPSRRDDVHLVVVGAGPHRGRLREVAMADRPLYPESVSAFNRPDLTALTKAL